MTIDPQTKAFVYDGQHLVATFEYVDDAKAYVYMAKQAIGANYSIVLDL